MAEGEEDDIIRSGWVEKKSMRSYKKTGFVRRFMVLSRSRLFYLSQPLQLQSSPPRDVHFEVTLDIICDIINRDYHERGLGKFDIVTPSRHLTIKCPLDDKLLWIRDIQNAREAYSNSCAKPSLYSNVPLTAHTPGVRKKIKSFLGGGNDHTDRNTDTFTYDQARALRELYDFLCSSRDICATVVSAVFESLAMLDGHERTKASRQLGQVLAMWLGESENCAENSRRASRLSISHAGKPSQIDMLTIWLEISLVREFKNSCTFSPQNSCNSPENADNDEHASRNIPFRRDNVECLFIQSFIRSIAQNTGMLSTWLMPSLHVISQNPQNFSDVKFLNSTPASRPENAESQMSIGGSLMSAFRSMTTGQDGHNEAEAVYRASTDNNDCSSDSKVESIATEDSGWRPGTEDFVHLEAQKIIHKMKSTEQFIPPSFKLLIATIYSLTVKTSHFRSFGPAECQTTEEGQHRKEDSRSGRGLTPEYGIYYASTCAALFLRLICPSLLSPLEWGVMSQRDMTHPSQAGDDPCIDSFPKPKKMETFKQIIFGDKKDNINIADSDTDFREEFISDMNKNPAAAAVILVAHILNSGRLEEVWSSNELDLDNFLQIQSNVVRLIPVEKLNVFIAKYESDNCCSAVDPSTRKTFESPEVRRALMSLAKEMQRIANLSVCLPQAMHEQAQSVQNRLNTKNKSNEDIEKDVIFYVEQAKSVQQLYDALGESSIYIPLVHE